MAVVTEREYKSRLYINGHLCREKVGNPGTRIHLPHDVSPSGVSEHISEANLVSRNDAVFNYVFHSRYPFCQLVAVGCGPVKANEELS
ncbi:MAG: hypothetical protein PHT27_07640 [Candidatus Izemoplasmatales bacterium]|nr:hypothetical protein [Candidatus Izemoplasmatales bacterium]